MKVEKERFLNYDLLRILAMLMIVCFHYCIHGNVQIDNRVSYIGNAAFYECSMTSVTLPESLTEIGEYAFKGSALTSITVPDEVEKIGVGAFSSVAYLKTAVLPDKLTIISKKLFEQDYRLLDVTIPSSLQRIEESAFSQCYGLKSVVLPEGLISIGNYAFWACGFYDGMSTVYESSNFTSVTLPSTLQEIGEGAFGSCSVLKSINIPNNVTEIRGQTFNRCTRLEKVVLPSSIKVIKNDAFLSCKALNTITFSWNAPQMDSEVFSNVVTATCYYPSNNSEWTSGMFKNYGAKKLTWVAKEMVKPSEGAGSGGSGSGGSGTGSGNNNSGSDSGSGSGSGAGGSGTGSGSGSSSGGTETGGTTGGNSGSGGTTGGSGSGGTTGSGSESGGTTGGSGSGETMELGFQAHSLTLDGEIGVNFYLELNDKIVQDTTATMTMEAAGKTISTVNVSDIVQNGVTVVKGTDGQSHNCYKFSCHVNAKQVADTIKATLKTKYGSWSEYYSVKKYAEEANASSSNENLKALTSALISYGQYTQILFGYNEASIDKSALMDVSSVTVGNLSSYKYSRSGSEDGLKLYGSSLLLKDKTTIRIYYELKSGSITDYTFKIDNEVVTPVQSGNNGLYYVEVRDIAAQDLETSHTFSAGQLELSNFSALSHVYSVLNYAQSASENKNAMAALYLYWQAAEKYFN